MAYGSSSDWNTQQQTVLEGTRALERTSESLYRAHQISLETEQMGTNVLNELSEQRESLLHTYERVEFMSDGLSRASRLLSAMSRHVLYNKIILIAIILLESCILGALIYIKFIKK